ncbi:MAG TPA: ATP-binding cassette domain-containing protein [Pseudomonadales bacterium]|nr:ATP-binding cassette domain-containing protein [Pseudomonadales bacterium]
MNLLLFRNISLSYGGPSLLDAVSGTVQTNERIALVGRNGAGKSTLLKVLGGLITPDAGDLERAQGIKIAYLPQEVPADTDGTVFDVTAHGLGEVGDLLARYEQVSCAAAENPALLSELEKIQNKLEALDAWNFKQKVDQTLSRLGLNPNAQFAGLSGGLKRRVLLAQSLVNEPQILLLDEPTNHLDIDSITWLEDFLLAFKGSIVFITHDRTFLQKLATKIIELDRGVLREFPCSYNEYLERKTAQLDAEEQQNDLFDKKLAQEEVWIRKGIKARRTRNEGRVRALIELRKEHAQRRERQGKVKLETNQAGQSGKMVIEASHINFEWNQKKIVRDFSLTVERGDRIAIIGPNGAGKTTLLKLLLKEIEPSSGTVRHGTQLQIAYFDQLRAQLDLEKSVCENVVQGSDFVTVNDKPKHIMSYLSDFLFAPERARTPVKALSGGERNRLLLAKLFIQPANLLVMDEPTNDLDIETLDLLEEQLNDFKGTLLLVSHDRSFINNIVTSCLVFENGDINEYVGGYDDWLRQRKPESKPATTAAPVSKPAAEKEVRSSPGKRKLSYKEQRELEELPTKIEQLEQAQSELHAKLADPAFFKQAPAEINAAQAKLAELEAALEHAYSRWGELDAI